ncbi:phospholipid-binding protein MlaC [Oceanicella sp. SM1341]|uniref:MlaC/ttg2D family ABC transporter substrate-binding protein n=1 Tax=Oceanicella sp. SM1341 TaxID=1548889 RepID=UPI001300AF1F|nr:ABC transporter substrate-binding protein [Oceanicella sp. SM1341]
MTDLPQIAPLSRRGLLGGALALGLVTVLGAGRPALAKVTEDQARDLVETVVGKLLDIANSTNDVGRQASEFRAMLAQYMAVDAVARSTLGPRWRELNAEQQAAYQDAFQDYVARKYAPRFNEFSQTRMEIVRTQDYGDRGVIVTSQATLSNGEKAMVDWGVTDRGGSLQLSNIVVEGISLVTSEREMIGSMLEKRGNDVDRLISDMKSGA